MPKTYTKLAAISKPAMEKVQFLCREKAISHGADETTEATVAPSPSRTNKDGSAQHNNVLNDVNRDKHPRTPSVRTAALICFP